MTMPMHNRDTNVRQFPPIPPVESEYQYQHQHKQSAGVPAAETVSSSTTTVQNVPQFDRFARQCLAMERLKKEFEDAFSRPMPRAIAETVLRDIRAGTPAAYYSYAIEQTIFAPRPSWRYTMAIIARLKRTMANEDDMDYRG